MNGFGKGSRGNQESTTPWHLEETHKALIPLSIEAIKTLALVNGGAAVAILAYWEISPDTRRISRI
jgi:hypothetical protein